MAHLQRCRRCRQPILSDARICPHCAVAMPSGTRRRLVLAGALAALLLVAAAFVLWRGSGRSGTGAAPAGTIAAPSSFEGPPRRGH